MLEFLFWFFLIIIMIRVTFRYLLPLLLVNFVRRQQRKFSEQQQQEDHNYRKEGEINVDYTKKSESKTNSDDKDAEYVDFEEL